MGPVKIKSVVRGVAGKEQRVEVELPNLQLITV